MEGTGKKGEEGIYLMPYSMEETDAWGGYASGMPFPGFYQRIWEKLEENKEKEQPQKGVYEGAVLDFLIETGRDGRKRTAFPPPMMRSVLWIRQEGLHPFGIRESPEPGN